MSETPDTTWYCARCLSTFRADEPSCPNLGCSRPRPATGWGRMYNAGDLHDRTYRIHRQLALGGAGITYLAREETPEGEQNGPMLAIKVLFTSRDEGPYLRRLATEAQILQELNHPHIVEYLGFVHRTGHSPYLITRFEQGGSLLDHLKRVGTLSVRQSAQIGRQVCWALQKAEEADIVHRDLKPENLLITRPVAREEVPVVRVADFGIAKVQSGLGSGLTRVGAFVGTPSYAAPELFAGREPTSATDVYGVGALLYFCLTAKTVVKFADRLAPDDSYQLLVDRLPPVVDGLDEPAVDLARLNGVLAYAMAVHPDERCTLDELDGMLESLAAGREPSPPHRRPAPNGHAIDAKPDAPLASPSSAGVGRQPTRSSSGTTSARPRHTGRMVASIGLVLLLGVAALGLAGALAWWRAPELLALVGNQLRPTPIELTGETSDPAALADYRGLVASARRIRRPIARACDVPKGTLVDAHLVVEPDGTARNATLDGADAGPASSCILKALTMATYTRSGDHPVRVQVHLEW